MTNEEAIKRLKEVQAEFNENWVDYGGINEAFEKAYQALQKGTEEEKPFVTECRDTAIKKNLPLYFIYYEETGIFEVYITDTKELFEKRHCSKHLSNSEFTDIVTRYLDDYSNWEGGAEKLNQHPIPKLVEDKTYEKINRSDLFQ